jgi:hypothetical protein
MSFKLPPVNEQLIPFIFKNSIKGKHAQKQRFLGSSSPIVGSVNRATVALRFSFISSVILCILLNDDLCVTDNNIALNLMEKLKA